MTTGSAISMQDIEFCYGEKEVLKHFNLEVKKGQIHCLVGSSGSGKTTALRIMNGLLRPKSGRVQIQGKSFDFSEGEQWRRSMGYSMQGSGLFPHMTLSENLSIIARREKWPKHKIEKRIEELCELMSLPSTPAFLNKKPRQISGGQQQRVGIARALFMKPEIMLMDEPFSALDPITRSELQNEFLRLQEHLGLTIVLVTHDLAEAFNMAHEIVLLNKGKIEQKGRPSRFLLSPATPYVEEFMRSHSPGNLLKSVYLYSVINTALYSSCKTDTAVVLNHLDDDEKMTFRSEEEAFEYLNNSGQSHIYWVDGDGNFESFEELLSDGSSQKSREQLISTDHILNGMNSLLRSKSSVLPVINKNGKMLGVFSREALNAL